MCLYVSLRFCMFPYDENAVRTTSGNIIKYCNFECNLNAFSNAITNAISNAIWMQSGFPWECPKKCFWRSRLHAQDCTFKIAFSNAIWMHFSNAIINAISNAIWMQIQMQLECILIAIWPGSISPFRVGPCPISPFR
jgi:hypothetical protein